MAVTMSTTSLEPPRCCEGVRLIQIATRVGFYSIYLCRLNVWVPFFAACKFFALFVYWWYPRMISKTSLSCNCNVLGFECYVLFPNVVLPYVSYFYDPHHTYVALLLNLKLKYCFHTLNHRQLRQLSKGCLKIKCIFIIYRGLAWSHKLFALCEILLQNRLFIGKLYHSHQIEEKIWFMKRLNNSFLDLQIVVLLMLMDLGILLQIFHHGKPHCLVDMVHCHSMMHLRLT